MNIKKFFEHNKSYTKETVEIDGYIFTVDDFISKQSDGSSDIFIKADKKLSGEDYKKIASKFYEAGLESEPVSYSEYDNGDVEFVGSIRISGIEVSNIMAMFLNTSLGNDYLNL